MRKGLLILISFMTASMAFGRVTLNQLNDFGSNPGNLKMFYFKPAKVVRKAPLVVLLHGCAQAASDFDDEIGWTQLAEKHGFYLLIPQQKEGNNDWRCFNWFQENDIARGKGEVASIVEMVEKMESEFSIDGKKVFATGLSAGAAMANVLLAAYPEKFSGGGLVAGIPYGCANNSINAWTCMYGTNFPIPSREQRIESVLQAFPGYRGKYPRVMVVHGTQDQFVAYKNGLWNVQQWLGVHKADDQADQELILDGHEYKVFKKGKRPVVSFLSISGLRHGYPVDSKRNCGAAGKFILDSGVCAAEHIAKFFGIIK